jgi:antirestriction protein ArdC
MEKEQVLVQLYQPIIKCLNQGMVPWAVPVSSDTSWRSLDMPLRDDSRPYEGINVLVLWASARLHGYRSAYWVTETQAKSKGGVLKADQQPTQLVMFPRDQPKGALYAVYNGEQFEGMPKKYQANPLEFLKPLPDQNEIALKVIQLFKGSMMEGVDVPYYAAPLKHFRVKPKLSFKDDLDYYGMWMNLLPHWASHEDNDEARKLGWKHYPPKHRNWAYSELVASMAAGYFSVMCGIPGRLSPDHTQLLNFWADYLEREAEDFTRLRKVAENTAHYLQRLIPRG